MSEPEIWAPEELTADAETAKALFRRRRLDEPLELYSRFFDEFVPVFDAIIDRLPSLADGSLDPAEMADLMADRNSRIAFRYLAAPPISEDDLKILAETTLSATALREDAEQAQRVRDVVLHVLDPHRFSWIGEHRDPREHERLYAVTASAVLAAARKVETLRRSDAKRAQEEAVKALLRDIGFSEIPPRDITLLDTAPAPGVFCGESKLGNIRADLVIRVHDRRVMPLECKVSNSAVNSFKRINHEAVGKARTWLTGFGKRQIVPAAVISGVFSPTNLRAAQSEGLTIFWSHRLQDLADFIESTRDD